MDQTGAMGVESGEMLFGTIAFVGLKTILRKLQVELVHLEVAINFGNDGGGGDRKTFLITFDNTQNPLSGFAGHPL